MDQQSIFSKTGKGMLEASGKTSLLPRATRKILSEIDGKSTVSELLKKFPALGGGKLETALAQMQKEGFLRERVSAQPAAMPVRPQASPPRQIRDGEDLDFTASGVFSESDLARAREDAARDLARKQKGEADRMMREAAETQARREAQAKAIAFAEMQAKARALAEATAKAKAEAQARREAEEKARKEAEARDAKEKALREIEELRGQLEEKRKAREETERIAREVEEKARREAEEQARREAEERARREAEEQAQREAEEQARREAEETARREAKEKAQREAKEQAKREAEERAQREAQEQARREAEETARREAEEKARREAEEQARREAEETARREAEEKARREAEEQAKREAEERALREAEEQARREAEETARREAEEKARREAEEQAKREAGEITRREAEEQAEREAEQKAQRETEEKARREAKEQAKCEAEEIARREAEEKARRETEENARLEAEEKVQREAEEKARREAKEQAKREAEEKARRKVEDLRQKLKAAERKVKEEAERRARESEEKAAAEMAAAQKAALEKASEKTPAKAASGDAFAESLLADLDAFAKREEEEAKKSEEEERERKEAVAREKIEAEERSRREEEERELREGEERRRRQEATARAIEEAERRAKEEAERKARERKPKAEVPMGKVQTADVLPPSIDSIPTSSADVAAAREARRAAREREREAERAKRTAAAAAAATADAAPVATPERRVKWGRTAAIGLFVLVAGGFGLLHVMPISTSDYARALSETIGQPVKIGSVNLSLYKGVELKIDNVQIGDGVRIARVRASLEPGSLLSEKKVFTQVHLDGAVLPQAMLGDVVFGSIKTDRARIGELNFSDLRIDGSLGLPKLAGELSFGEDGKVAAITLTGGGDAGITGRIVRKGDSAEFTVNAASAPIPFVPGLNLAGFAMRGSANRQEMTVRAFNGRVYDGVISGNARISWSGGWRVAGDVAAKQVNAAVFAPVLISEGKLDANGRYALQGPDPARLGPDGRLEGSFAITKGAIGFVDIVRMIQSPISKIRVRTAFNELTGRGVYNKGATELRDIHLTAGVLNANAVLDIDAAGGLKGRMNADLKSAAAARGALSIGIGGNLADPQIRRQ